MSNSAKTNSANIVFGSYSNYILAFGLVAVLATLIIPLPTFILDMLLACSISLAIAVLIVTLSSKEALELSTFPSLLLFVTLFRLSLNVASTRLILLQGDAGKIIETFGGFVAGGSFVVGLVIFLILVVILVRKWQAEGVVAAHLIANAVMYLIAYLAYTKIRRRQNA